MELYDVIFRRKSVRKFLPDALDEKALRGVREQTQVLRPLFADIPVAFELLQGESVKGLFSIQAPQYLALYSAEADGFLLNAGFLLQQMDLYLSSVGIGSCWLGVAKPGNREKDGLKYVMMLAFGAPDEPVHREDISEFRRRLQNEIARGQDERLEAVRLAPSAMNNQSWFLDCQQGAIDLYQVKSNPLKAAVMDRLNAVNSGIALCHLMLATEHLGREFAFARAQGKSRKGYTYVGSVE